MFHFDLSIVPTPIIHLLDIRNSTPTARTTSTPKFHNGSNRCQSLISHLWKNSTPFAKRSGKKLEETWKVLNPMKCLPTRLHYARHVSHLDKWHIFHLVDIFHPMCIPWNPILSPYGLLFPKHHCLLIPHNLNFAIFIHMSTNNIFFSTSKTKWFLQNHQRSQPTLSHCATCLTLCHVSHIAPHICTSQIRSTSCISYGTSSFWWLSTTNSKFFTKWLSCISCYLSWLQLVAANTFWKNLVDIDR